MTNRSTADPGCLLAVGLAVLLLSACSSPAHSSAPTAAAPTAAAATAIASTCERVGAVLSDGPDPDADPVGYAEAQVLPLRQIHASDQALRSAISRLADAYRAFYASDGKSSQAKQAVAAAITKINSFCPGAAS
jgi:uncharacterized heparinase superfamily protein